MPETDEPEELRRRLSDVTAERDRLLVENRHLRRRSSRSLQEAGQLSLPFADPGFGPSNIDAGPVPALPASGNDSPLFQKISLFRSLFRGREDVFAWLWWSSKSQKVGYSPVYKYEWNRDLCGKPRVRCGDCPNRDFVPLTEVVIQGHLEGKHTVGVYPLLQNDTCCFLALDFDKQSCTEDIAAFRKTCRREDVPAAIERSRSGNGGHVWIFFSEAVPASQARKLGCYLVTETMSRRHQLGMDSYDRLFPNQDSVPKGGFGNLIALPLQKEPAERGNTLFLDDNFRPYEDQWAFLASIRWRPLPSTR